MTNLALSSRQMSEKRQYSIGAAPQRRCRRWGRDWGGAGRIERFEGSRWCGGQLLLALWSLYCLRERRGE
jgi:hypothetical protein